MLDEKLIKSNITTLHNIYTHKYTRGHVKRLTKCMENFKVSLELCASSPHMLLDKM